MKVLIIRFSSIGDIVLTSPVIRSLKLQLDNCEVHYCTKKTYLPLLEANPYISKIHTLDSSLNQLIRELRQEKFDFVIDLHNNLRTFIIKQRLGVPNRSFDKLNVLKWLLVNFKINRLPNVHIVDRYLAATQDLGVKKDTTGLDYFIPEKDLMENEWLPVSHQNGYVAFCIGGQFQTKRLPLKRMIELCDKINKPIILLGGKEDSKNGEEIESFFEASSSSQLENQIQEKLNKKAIIFNACGKLNINQSASIIKNASVVFTHDTGLMHIAAAFRKNIFSIWGSTVPEFGMYPYNTSFTLFENKKLNCRPCSKIGFNTCPKGHFKCMNDIVFDFYLPG